MKNKLLHYSVLFGKFTFYCYLIQALILNTLLAKEARGQYVKSVKEVYISVNLKNAKLQEVFRAIETGTDYDFVYNHKDLNRSTRFNLSGDKKTVEEVLMEVSRQGNLEFRQVNNRISAKKHVGNHPPKKITVTIQQREISGRVTDENGEPLPGATILVKGTTSGTVTDVDGHYRITVDDDEQALVISFVGYETIELVVGNRSVLDISLKMDISNLSEIVVVGYGTQERARVTGAISSLTAEDISQMAVVSLDQALQGQAAGITIANTGSPGVNPIVRIRGLGTVGNNNPLYVIDGMPVGGSTPTPGGNQMSSSGGLNGLNPNDIESIQILKDASASAIYGSRAANGVILITTKKGQKGRTSINIDAYTGVQNAWRTMDLLNTEQYLEYGEMLLGSDVPDRFNDLGEFANVDTDWQDEMFRPASIQDYNISVNGGTENALFNISGGYFNQEGIMLGTGFKRYSFRTNSEFTMGKFKVGETLTLSYSERQNEPYNGARSQIEHLIKMVPYIPVRDPDMIGGFRSTDLADGSDPENPVLNAMLRRNVDENMKLLGTAYASYEIIEGLEYKLLLGMDMDFGFNKQFTPVIVSSDSYHLNPTADLSQNRSDYISPLISNRLSYKNSFGDHTIDVIAVAERQTHVGRNTQASGETDLTSAIEELGIAQNPIVGGNKYEYALLSYLGRINYDFQGKYLLSASVRRDGGSRFGTDTRWGTFPSVSAGWRISQESFMSNVPFLNDLKIRASWGKVGNDNIGNYGYQATIASGQFYILGPDQAILPGFTTRALANEGIKWETTVMTNFGLDMELFNGKVTASVEYFNNETQDMLLPVPIPPSLGLDVAPIDNVGNVLNKGFELTAAYNQFDGDFQWSLGGNLSFIRNELTSLGIGTEVYGSLFEGYNTTSTKEGEPIAYFYGWEVDGIFQTDAEVQAANALDGDADSPYQTTGTVAGDIRFKDINGDNVVNDDDRTNLGHFLPDFSYGLNGNAKFRNFDLTLFIQGVSGNEILNTNLYDLEGMTRLFNSGTQVLDAWTETNPNTDIPRAANGDPNFNARISSRYIEDGSYLRIKNLTIGYQLPANLLGNIGNGFVKNLRLYVTSQNLLTITSYSGYDPEIGARPDLAGNPSNATLNSGVDWGQYPQPRTFLGGIQIGF